MFINPTYSTADLILLEKGIYVSKPLSPSEIADNRNQRLIERKKSLEEELAKINAQLHNIGTK